MLKNKVKSKFSVLKVILFVFLFLYAISLLLPLLWGFVTSLRVVDDYEIFEQKLWFPTRVTFDNFVNAFKYFYVQTLIGEEVRYFYVTDMLFNSIAYSVGCAFLSTASPCIVAYLCARFQKYKFGKFIYALVLFTMILPIVGSLPSQIVIANKLKIYDTFLGVYLMSAHFISVYFLVFHAQFVMIPKDYTEAAQIDGASNSRVMFMVIMPLASNTIFTVFLLQFISFWNNYQTPMIFLPSHPVAAFGMYYFQWAQHIKISNVPTRLAGTMILAIPIIILFAIFNKKLTVNVSAGGIKF